MKSYQSTRRIIAVIFAIGLLNHFNWVTAQTRPGQANYNSQRTAEPSESNEEYSYLWSNESFSSYAQSAEVTEKRTANSKTFRSAGGSYTAFLTSGDIHYSENGKWKTIFHTIVPSSNGFQNITNKHKTYYPATSSGSIRTVLPNGGSLVDMKDMRMYYEVNGQVVQSQNIQNKQGMIHSNKLTYSDVYGAGINLRLTQNTTQRKMDYIIQNAGVLANSPSGAQFLVFEEKAELPSGWTAQLVNNEILLKDASGNTIAKYEKPIYSDTPVHHHQEGEEHNHGEEEIEGTYVISQNGNILTIKTKVPLLWLTSSERNFPLIIDPTINLYPNSATRWTGNHELYANPVNYASTNINNSYDGDFYVGRNSTNYIHNGWVKYNVSSVPVEACINSAIFAYNIIANNTNQSTCSVPVDFRHMAADPSANAFDGNGANNQARLADIRNGVIYGSYNTAVYASGTGWQIRTLSANMADLSAQIPQGWFAIGLHVTGGNSSHTTCRNTIAGHSNTLKPYLTIQYSMPAIPLAGKNVLCVGETTQLTSGGMAGITGGTITYANGYKIHTFTGNGTLTLPAGVSGSAEVLVVAGGGGGGLRHAGGGGAGGVIQSSYFISGNQTVVVGAGGNGDTGSGATNGQNSSFGTLTAIGGGYGSTNGGPANAGGSGGGGSNGSFGGAGTIGQGFKGGDQNNGAGCCYANGAGGGGAGIAGANTTGGNSSNGGAGIESSISGTATWYAGGGGGGKDATSAVHTGGTGGGGSGGNRTTLNGTNGTANTGGGGGGGGANGGTSGNGGNGGSGIVIVRYADPSAQTWQSGNTSVATVSSTGLVTAVGKGTAQIYNISQAYCQDAITTIIVTDNDVEGILVKEDPTSCTPQNGTISAYVQEENFKGASVWYQNSFNSASPELGTSTISGSAALNSNNMRLTDAVNSQSGALTVNNPGLNASSVAATFDLYIGGGSGADGFQFTYGDILVRFDTYNNASPTICEGQNTSGGSVGIGVYQNGTLITGGCHQYLNIRNNWQNVFFHIDIAGRVYLKVGNTVLFNYVSLTNPGGYDATNKSAWTWVFQGNTGGANDQHRIDNLQISAFNQYSYRLNAGSWQTSNVFTNVGSGTHTVYARPRVNGSCSEGTVGVIKNTVPDDVTITPSPVTVCEGGNVSLTATVTPPNTGTMYVLIFPSAYGGGWHGLQEIRGRNSAGALQTLSCLTASSATYTTNLCGSPDYGAGNAFDGDLPGAVVGVQWLTPKEELIQNGGGVNTNWRNVGTYAPFYSPEWIAFSSPTALSQIEIRNGRYATGASSTCFRDYHLMASNDGGATWTKIKQGTLLNDQGIDQTISVLPADNNYVWKRGATIVGTGPTLNLTNVTAAQSGTYTLEVGYDLCNIISRTVNVTVSATSTVPTSVTGGGNYCYGNTINLNSSGGTNGTNVTYVWYKGGCNNAFTETWNNQPYATGNTTVNSINNGILNVTSTTNDPVINMYGVGSFNPNVYKYLNIRYRVTAGTATSMQIFYNNALYGSANAAQYKDVPVTSPLNTWQIVSIDMTTPTTGNWFHSNITGWRLDWATANGVTMEIDFVQLSEFPMIDEDNTTSQLEWTPSHPHYPTAGTTIYATAKIDNCGATTCASTTVTLPNRTTVLALNSESATCVVGSNETVHFYNTTSGRYIATVTANATALGSTTSTAYIDAVTTAPYANPIMTQACNDPGFTTATLGRHWVINPTTNASATVRLPYYDQELQLLVPTSGVPSTNPYDQVAANASNLGLSKYSGPANVNNSWNDNCPALGGNGGTSWQGPNNYGNLSAYAPGWPANTDRYSLFNITGFSEFWLHASDPVVTPLPITLSSFSTNCDGMVFWTTSSEQNSDYFTLERSRDGYNWDIITTVNGAGITNAVNNYQVIDNVAGDLYYRLKHTDFDGKTEVFGPIFRDCSSANNELIVYPNPNTGTFTVAINSSEEIGEATVLIHDVSGKLVAFHELNVLAGMNTVYFENTHLMRGTYLVSVQGKDNKVFIPVKLIIQ